MMMLKETTNRRKKASLALTKRLTAWLLMFTLVFYNMPFYAFADDFSEADVGNDVEISESVDGPGTEPSDEDGSGAAGDTAVDNETGSADDESQDPADETNGEEQPGETDPAEPSEDEPVGDVTEEQPTEPSDDEPAVDDEPADNEPIVDDEPTVNDEPVVNDEPSNDDVANEEQPGETDPADKPIVEDPVVDEPIVDEPTVDEPVITEPVVTPEPEVPAVPEVTVPIEQVPVLPEVDMVVGAVQDVVAAAPMPEVPVVQPIIPELSVEVQAFLEAVAQLPEVATKENWDELSTALDAVVSLFEQLTDDEQEYEDVVSAYMQVVTLWEQHNDVKAALLAEYPIKYSENNIDYELYADGTAKVTKGKKDEHYRLIIPEFVTYNDKEYKVTVIGYNSCSYAGYVQLVLPEGLKTIEGYAFYADYLYGPDLVIPNSVTSIGDCAFALFNAYATEQYHINKIVFGDGLQSIGKQAFYYNPGNKAFEGTFEVEMGTNIESIDPWAFYCDTSDSTKNAVSSVTVRGYNGAVDQILQSVYAFRTIEVVYTLGFDLEHIASLEVLQQAINAADEPITLTMIPGEYSLNQTIVIPDGKDITIKDNGEPCKIVAAYSLNGPMFLVEPAGKLTIDGTSQNNLHIAFQVKALDRMQAAVADVDGTLVLREGKISGGYIEESQMFSGVILLNNVGAKFVMNGGIITDTFISGDFTAPVIIGPGAEFNMNGGFISNNINVEHITPNSCSVASAVLIYSWNEKDPSGTMTMSNNAQISGNTNKGMGGAVTLVRNAEFVMDGGIITDNHSTGLSKSDGGGVCVAGYLGPDYSAFDAKCVFTMNGGTISNNTANYGGGIYVNSNYVTLNAGQIINNSADNMMGTGGGIYVETPPSSIATSVRMSKALIMDNTARIMGGGMYFCPTGNGSLYVNEGAAIFNNSSTGAADDFVSVAMPGHKKIAKLSERMLGGGLIDWYVDGSVKENIGGAWGSVTNELPRYNAVNPVPIFAGDYNYSIALKSVVSEGAASLAKSQATLIIAGNKAARGGGIGANGSVIIGEPSQNECSLQVTKAWSDDIPESEWKPVRVQLMIDEYALETVELNTENNWTAEFTGLPESAINHVSVKELTTGYIVNYSDIKVEGNKMSVVVTNSKEVNLQFIKLWANDTENDRPEQVIFKLMLNNVFKQDIILNAANGWQASLEHMEGKGEYSVEEIEVSGYTSEKLDIVVDGNTITFTIKNTKEEPKKPEPEKISVTVIKDWADDTEADRPEQIVFALMVDDMKVQDIVLNAANGWQATVGGLEEGPEYTIIESEVEGYISGTPVLTMDGKNFVFTVTNTKIKTETIDLMFVKLWANDEEANRPEQVIFKLLVDGIVAQDIILNAANNWQFKLTGLEASHDYSVEEVMVPDYTTGAVVKIIEDGVITFTVTNTRTVTPPTPVTPNTPDNPSDDGGDDPTPPPTPTTNIDEPPVPLTEQPNDEEYIFDDEVPLAEQPVEEEVILDEEVPLAQVPKTGDNLILWFFATAISGIVGLVLARKRS